MAAEQVEVDVDPPVTEDAGDGAVALAGERVVACRTVESWAGPITVLVSAPRAADRQDVESATYSAGNEVARLTALATGDQLVGEDDDA